VTTLPPIAVRELIAKLRTFPPDAVVIATWEGQGIPVREAEIELSEDGQEVDINVDNY
jgi:hypothetical protein